MDFIPGGEGTHVEVKPRDKEGKRAGRRRLGRGQTRRLASCITLLAHGLGDCSWGTSFRFFPGDRGWETEGQLLPDKWGNRKSLTWVLFWGLLFQMSGQRHSYVFLGQHILELCSFPASFLPIWLNLRTWHIVCPTRLSWHASPGLFLLLYRNHQASPVCLTFCILLVLQYFLIAAAWNIFLFMSLQDQF